MKIIKKGYKQTEVGVIPEDWEVKTIESLAVLKAGKSVSFKGNLGGRYPCFGGNGVRDYVSFYSHDGSFPIIGRQGELCGNVSYGEGKFYATEHAIVSKSKKNIESKWLYYSLINANLNQYATGCAQPGLSVVNVNVINMCCPSYVEQCAISTALSDIDSLISSLNKKIEKKKAFKQGLMQQLLTGKKRLSGFSGEWIEKKLGDVAIIKDGTHQTPKYVENGGIPFYSVENVSSNDFKHVKQISYAEHKILTKSYKIEIGDVLMTRIGSIGVCKYVDWNVDASFYVSLALLKIKLDNDARFIAFYSNLKCFKDEIDLNSLIFAIPQKINLGNISYVKIILTL